MVFVHIFLVTLIFVVRVRTWDHVVREYVHTTSSSQADVPILIFLDTADLISRNLLNSSCDGMYFEKEGDSNVPLPFFIENEENCGGTSTQIWVRVSITSGVNRLRLHLTNNFTMFDENTNGKLTWNGSYVFLMDQKTCPTGYDPYPWNDFSFLENTNILTENGKYVGNQATDSPLYHNHTSSTITLTERVDHSENYIQKFLNCDDCTVCCGSYYYFYTINHRHSLPSPSFTSSRFQLPFYNMIYCKSKSPNVKRNGVVIFTTSSLSDFQRFTKLDERFARGVPNDHVEYGVFGGESEYFSDHIFSDTLGSCIDGGRDEWDNEDPVGEGLSDLHKHNFSQPINHTDMFTIPSFQVIFGINNNVEEMEFEDNMLIMVDSKSLPPMGYELYNNVNMKNKIITGSATFGSYSSGSFPIDLSHSHDINFETKPENTYQWEVVNFEAGSSPMQNVLHPHQIVGTSSANIEDLSNVDPYRRKMVLIKKAQSTITFHFEREVIPGEGGDDDDDDDDDSKGGTVAAIISVFSVLFALLVCIIMCIVGIVLIGVIIHHFKKRGVGKKLSRKLSFLVNEEELEEETKTQPEIEINKEFFRVPFKDVKLIEEISHGLGGSSSIYRAEWGGRDVAFKIFRCGDMTDSNLNDFDSFERELSLMASLSHPGIITFFGCSMKSPRIGIIMEVTLGENYGFKCDIFSFSMICYEVISEKMCPFGDIDTPIEFKIATRPDFRRKKKFSKFNYAAKIDEGKDSVFYDRKWLWVLLQKCWDHSVDVRPGWDQVKTILQTNFFDGDVNKM